MAKVGFFCCCLVLFKDPAEFSYAGAGAGHSIRSPCADNFEKLLFAEHNGAAESGVAAGADQFGHAPNVIVMPVGGNNEADVTGGIDTEVVQILQRSRFAGRVNAGVDENPSPVASVQGNAFTVPGPKEGDFKFIVGRR